jgi:hypothetical protein
MDSYNMSPNDAKSNAALSKNVQAAMQFLGTNPTLEGLSAEQKELYFKVAARAGESIKQLAEAGRLNDAMPVQRSAGPLFMMADAHTTEAERKTLMDRLPAIDKNVDNAEQKFSPAVRQQNEVEGKKILGYDPSNSLQNLSQEQKDGYYDRLVRMNDVMKQLDGQGRTSDMMSLQKYNAFLHAAPERLGSGASFSDMKETFDKVDVATNMASEDLAQGRPTLRENENRQEAPAPEKPGRLSRAWQSIKDGASRAYEAIKNLPETIRDRFSSTPAAATPAQATPQAQQVVTNEKKVQGKGLEPAIDGHTQYNNMPPLPATPANNLNVPPLPATPAPGDNNSHISVMMGSDENHEQPKGVGFQTGGKVDSVEHKDGMATIHYKTGGHDRVVSIDENKNPALVEAVDHLKPGDQFDMKIAKDGAEHEVAQIHDKSDGHEFKVHDNGQLEEKIESPNLQRSNDRTR